MSRVTLLTRLVLLLLMVAACSGEEKDEGNDTIDGGGDGGTGNDSDTNKSVDQCKKNDDCNDGAFCNGLEICAPGDDDAAPNGCKSAEEGPCGDKECDEDLEYCICANPDMDGDGKDSVECGGDDCDDNDRFRFTGNTEVCDADGHDEDCDLTTLGGPKDKDVDDDGFVSGKCCNLQEDNTMLCGNDCDDLMAGVNPEATESCNHIDDNCDGVTDEGVYVTFYMDFDNDGFGSAAEDALTKLGCPGDFEGYDDKNTDCDDENGAINPAAEEICESALIDENCSGFPDDPPDGCDCHLLEERSCFEAKGICANGIETCIYNGKWGACSQQPEDEVCDGLDNDCDGIEDEGTDDVPDSLKVICYVDEDGDELALEDAESALLCGCGEGYTITEPDSENPETVDCDDKPGQDDVYPGAEELCDGKDNDCDGETDEDSVNETTCYHDMDNDTYAAEDASSVMVCACGDYLTDRVPDGNDPLTFDCNDDKGNEHIYPGANEVCDMADNDCDGLMDEDENEVDMGLRVSCYTDMDMDHYAALDAVANLRCGSCNENETTREPEGGNLLTIDCDDENPEFNPTITEICNSFDDDCDGVTDEDPYGNGTENELLITCYEDVDMDSFGETGGTTQEACLCATGWSSVDGDCNDSNPLILPGASEVCDYVDNNCNGFTDEDELDTPADNELHVICYEDIDGDNYGNDSVTKSACSCSGNWTPGSGDCDDNTYGIHPNATEICDGTIDHNCNGLSDSVDGCNCDNGDTQSCGSTDTGECEYGTETCALGQWGACIGAVEPGTETCNSRDDDCDGDTDEADAVGAPTWYRDSDGDNYGDSAVTTVACTKPGGYVDNSNDCNDGDADIHKNAMEICDGTIDHNCNGLSDSADGCNCDNGAFQDCGPFDAGGTDLNGLETGECRMGTEMCTSGQWGACVGDVGPATETCNSRDDDCDGDTDEDDADGAPTWYWDNDGDNYGDLTITTTACVQPSGYVMYSTDCDDSKSAVHPNATEICDGTIDHNCNEVADLSDGCNCINGNDRDCGPFDGDGNDLGGLETGYCRKGTQQCIAGFWGSCTNYQGPLDNEICNNGIDDDDCDGLLDEADGDAAGLSTWYLDNDGDQLGDSGNSVSRCSHPGGSYVSNDVDCYDSDDAVLSINSCARIMAPETTYTCQNDDCEITACPDGLDDCNADHLDHCETDITKSMRYCGSCDRLLSDSCQIACGEVGGFVDCDDIAMMNGNEYHTCATRDSGKVACWGKNEDGRLGTYDFMPSVVPRATAIITETIDVAAGYDHSCAIGKSSDGDASVYCWGNNSHGQCGTGVTANEFYRPMLLAGWEMDEASDVSAGTKFSCGISENDYPGSVWCWGINDDGQLGIGSITPAEYDEPARVDGVAGSGHLEDIDKIASGSSHTCAIDDTNDVFCWGDLGQGALGIGTSSTGGTAHCNWSPPYYCTSPVAVDLGGENAIEISAGNMHTCVIIEGTPNTVKCWGTFTSYCTGVDCFNPTDIADLTGAVEIASGGNHVCAILGNNSNKIRCIGSNSNYQLGSSTTGDTLITTTETGFTHVSAGRFHTCSISSDGIAKCWGENNDGQLGVGDTIDKSSPTDIEPLLDE